MLMKGGGEGGCCCVGSAFTKMKGRGRECYVVVVVVAWARPLLR